MRRLAPSRNILLFAASLSQCPLIGYRFAAMGGSSRISGREVRYSKLGMDGFTDIPFNTAADAFLERVENTLEEVDSAVVEDATLSDGVLTIETAGKGTFVLNKQAPNVQLWLSSPISGPHHYDMFCEEGDAAMRCTRWVSDNDGHSLKERLETELTEVLEVHVKL